MIHSIHSFKPESIQLAAQQELQYVSFSIYNNSGEEVRVDVRHSNAPHDSSEFHGIITLKPHEHGSISIPILEGEYAPSSFYAIASYSNGKGSSGRPIKLPASDKDTFNAVIERKLQQHGSELWYDEFFYPEFVLSR